MEKYLNKEYLKFYNIKQCPCGKWAMPCFDGTAEKCPNENGISHIESLEMKDDMICIKYSYKMEAISFIKLEISK